MAFPPIPAACQLGLEVLKELKARWSLPLNTDVLTLHAALSSAHHTTTSLGSMTGFDSRDNQVLRIMLVTLAGQMLSWHNLDQLSKLIKKPDPGSSAVLRWTVGCFSISWGMLILTKICKCNAYLSDRIICRQSGKFRNLFGPFKYSSAKFWSEKEYHSSASRPPMDVHVVAAYFVLHIILKQPLLFCQKLPRKINNK